uniref:HIG1 domain-containing protein n=1 Tax=Parascaris univalens TaxID=6257 RepID=A0A914ZNY4_PARUN
YIVMSISPENVSSFERRNMQWRIKEIRRNGNMSFNAIPMIPREYARGVAERGQPIEGSIWRNALNNPFVPLGMLATVGCLVGMCRATLHRNMMRAQLYMRGRVAAQFFTVCVLVGGALAYGKFDPSKLISHKKDAQFERNSSTHGEPI